MVVVDITIIIITVAVVITMEKKKPMVKAGFDPGCGCLGDDALPPGHQWVVRRVKAAAYWCRWKLRVGGIGAVTAVGYPARDANGPHQYAS